MKSVFCRRRIILNTGAVIHRFRGLLEKVDTTTVNPLVESIKFDGPCLTKDLELYVKKCLSLFPDASLKRGHCKQITFLPTLWFAEGTTLDKPIFTNRVGEAEDKLSLACGGTVTMNYPNPYNQRIELYGFPDYIDKRVSKVFLIYTVLHEYAHSLQKPAYSWRNYAMYVLRDVFPKKPTYRLKIKGNEIDPRIWQDNFMGEALTYPPITTYSSIYEKIESDIRTHEYMADYIATYLMGMAMSLGMLERWQGLGDRPKLLKKIKEFLEAEAIIEIA